MKKLVIGCSSMFDDSTPMSALVACRIEEQTHYGKEFGVNGDSFIASNGVLLRSSEQESGIFTGKEFLVKSKSEEECESKHRWLSLRDYLRLRQAALEYNAFYT